MMDQLNICMLDGFSIQSGGVKIDDSKSRTKKIWLLLAYLIFHRSRAVSQDELHQLLWGNEESKDDPQNALRVMLHRARTQLDQLGPNMGRTLLLRQKDGYRWNPDIPIQLDAEQFEALCAEAASATEPAEQTDLYRKALALYRTDFLQKLSGEDWARMLAVHFHDLYLDAVHAQLLLLEQQSLAAETASLCRSALAVEPFSENLYFHLLRSLLALGRQQEAIAAYEEAREVFATNFGTLPAEEIRRLYYEAMQDVHDHTVPIEELYHSLQEEETRRGALLCDYDFFKTVFQSTVRLISRSGIAVHLAVLTASGKDGQPLPKRSLEYIMECLGEQVCLSLRRGDVVTRSSLYQYAVILQMATYENSCMVCDRIIKAYNRAYPHSPAQISYAVQEVSGEML